MFICKNCGENEDKKCYKCVCDNCEGTGLEDIGCPTCSGTGEGQADGTDCISCHGSGECITECTNPKCGIIADDWRY